MANPVVDIPLAFVNYLGDHQPDEVRQGSITRIMHTAAHWARQSSAMHTTAGRVIQLMESYAAVDSIVQVFGGLPKVISYSAAGSILDLTRHDLFDFFIFATDYSSNVLWTICVIVDDVLGITSLPILDAVANFSLALSLATSTIKVLSSESNNLTDPEVWLDILSYALNAIAYFMLGLASVYLFEQYAMLRLTLSSLSLICDVVSGVFNELREIHPGVYARF